MRFASNPRFGELKPTDLIRVCDNCWRSACWQGDFLCEKARTAGCSVVTVSALRAAKTGEHESNWITEA